MLLRWRNPSLVCNSESNGPRLFITTSPVVSDVSTWCMDVVNFLLMFFDGVQVVVVVYSLKFSNHSTNSHLPGILRLVQDQIPSWRQGWWLLVKESGGEGGSEVARGVNSTRRHYRSLRDRTTLWVVASTTGHRKSGTVVCGSWFS